MEPIIGRLLVLLDRVPLVEHQHEALTSVQHVAHDVGVLGGVALDGIGHHDGHIGSVDRLHGAQHGVAFDPPFDRATPADAGGVDQDHRLTIHHHRAVDRVAGGARNVGHDHPLLAQYAVYER